MRIFVTGATGFIGRNLAPFLAAKGHTVAVLARPGSLDRLPAEIPAQYRFVFDGELGSLQQALASFKPEAVIHLASLFVSEHNAQQVKDLIESNVLFGAMILETMHGVGCRLLINTGTSWQHFNDEEYSPVNLYAATKEAFEKIAKFYAEVQGFRIINLHLFDTYGENDTRKKLFNLLENTARSGETLGMSAGEQFLNISHVDDVCAAYDAALKTLNTLRDGEIKTYAVRAAEELNLRQIVELFNAAKPESRANVNWGARPYRKREVMRPWKGETVPGWKSSTPLAEGLKRLRRTRH